MTRAVAREEGIDVQHNKLLILRASSPHHVVSHREHRSWLRDRVAAINKTNIINTPNMV